jgi:hypothetical protein
LQLRHFNQTAAISSTTKLLTKAGATAGKEKKPKPSQSSGINESQQQTKRSPETTEDEQKQQQNETDKLPVPLDVYKFVAALDRLIGQLPVEKPANSGLQKMAIIHRHTDHFGDRTFG